MAPVASAGRFATPWFQLAIVEWEILLGVWLLSGWHRTGAWVAAVGTFLAFAAVSGQAGFSGQASCGCFGTVETSPWYAFAFDLIALGLLAAVRPGLLLTRNRSPSSLPERRSDAAVLIGGGGALVAVVVAVATFVYGTPQTALARLRGEPVTVTPAYVDFGEGAPDQVLQATIEVRNWADKPVRLIGGTSDCSCVTTVGLPVVVAPGGVEAVPVRLKVPASEAGVFTRTAELWTDHERARTVRLTVGCQVR